MLTGKKTYISAGILALATFARWVGWLDQNQLEIILGLGGSLGLAGLRAGIAKAGEEAGEQQVTSTSPPRHQSRL